MTAPARFLPRWDKGKQQWIVTALPSFKRVAAFDKLADASHWIASQKGEPATQVTEDVRSRVLLALVFVYRCDGRATVRTVAAAAGKPVMTTHQALASLRDEGLIAWEPGRHGTLRPLVGAVA